MGVNIGNADYMSGVGDNIQRYVEHGVKFHFTNVAVPDSEKFLTDEKQTQQATLYGHLFTTCVNAINCQVFQLASFADTWNSNFAIGTEPFPFSKHFLQKKAASSMLKIINGGITNTYADVVGSMNDDSVTDTTTSAAIESHEAVSSVSSVPSDYEQVVEDSFQKMSQSTSVDADASTYASANNNDDIDFSNTDSLTGIETDDLLAQLQAE